MARRDDREYREYLRKEQRSQPGCPARKAVLLQRGQATRQATSSPLFFRAGAGMLLDQHALQRTGKRRIARGASFVEDTTWECRTAHMKSKRSAHDIPKPSGRRTILLTRGGGCSSRLSCVSST